MNKITMNIGDTFVVSQNSFLYQKALKREIGIWQNSKQEDFISERFHEVIFQHGREKVTFISNKDWIDFFSTFGPFNNSIILGGNNTNLEEYLIAQKIVSKIENLDIIFKNDFSNKINKFNDLNFIDLPEKKYDLIIAKSILHHIINLEHLVLQVNKSLTENGIFVVFEYVGENKQQWDQNKIDIINSEFSCEDILPGYKFARSVHNYYNNWPFESIRSQEIVTILHKIFDEKIIEIEWGKLNWPIDYHISQYCYKQHITLDNEKRNILKNRANCLDSLYLNDKSLKSSYLFGLYKKCLQTQFLGIKKWNKSKLKKELKLRGPLKIRLKSLITTCRNNILVKILSNIKKFIRRIR